MDIEFLTKLKVVLESDLLNQNLLERGKIDSDERNLFIYKTLNYLISTRDFEGFNTYLSKYFIGDFPRRYLQDEKDLSKEEAQSLIYSNFVLNGFLFHITQKHNVDRIFETGLQTLNDRYNCDVYQKCFELEEIYQNIKQRNKQVTNSENETLFDIANLIHVPGEAAFRKIRFETVYLASDLLSLLGFYGKGGEFYNLFLESLFYSFKNHDNLDNLSKEEIRKKIISLLNQDNVTIFDKEKEFIINYFDMFCKDNKKIKNS